MSYVVLQAVAAGRVNGANPPTLGLRSRGFTVTSRTSAGVYVLTLDSPLNEGSCVLSHCASVATAAGVGAAANDLTFCVQHTSDTSKTVVQMLAGAASDAGNADLIFWELPAGR